MKTKVEINGYEIEIELVGGLINVVATKDGEPVEEFSIETEGSEEGEEIEDVQGFDEFEEEEDFGGEELQDEEEGDELQDEEEDELQDEDEDEDDEEESDMKALESFQSFLNKKTKK